MAWRLARSLVTLLAQINSAAPSRSRLSDGTIGDSAHASRASDHNTNEYGVVRALDVTDDPAHGCDADDIARWVATNLGKHPALMSGAYVIRSSKIISYDRLDEGWRPYTGLNAHEKHVHISVSTDSRGYDSTVPWPVFPKDGPVPIYDSPDGLDYRWFQPGGLGSPESGVVLGVRRAFGGMSQRANFLGSPASREGRNVRERRILRAKVISTTPVHHVPPFLAVSGHAPPSWAPNARATYMRALARLAAQFKGGDLNLAKRVVERLLARRVVGGGVLWLSLPRTGWKVVNVSMVDVGSDHKAALVKVRHRKTGGVVTFLVINCMSVTASKTASSHVMKRGLALGADVIMASECSDFRARQIDKKDK